MTKDEFEELKAKWKVVEAITPWEKIRLNAKYHIPPVLGLKRRDIIVTSLSGEELSFKRADGETENEVGKFHKTSVFAKCMIEEKVF
jgi:hypothetical protein